MSSQENSSSAMERTKTELEQAAVVLLASPSEVTNEERKSASEVFALFKRTNSPYELCRFILDNSKVGYVLFQAVDAVKGALMREWRLHEKSDIKEIMLYLYTYGKENAHRLPSYVKEKIAQTVAIVIKKRSFEDNGELRGYMLENIAGTIYVSGHFCQLFDCTLLTNMLNEYAVSSKSSEIGLTLKQNFQCKEQFEEGDIKRVFIIIIGALHNLVNVETPFDEPIETMFKQLLIVAETLLSWNFSGPSRVFSTSAYQMNATPKLNLDYDWRDVILENSVVNLFYTVYCKVRHVSTLGHLTLSCLNQLASLHGNVFGSKDSRLKYLDLYLQGFLKLVLNAAIMDKEVIWYSSIVRELMSIFNDVLLPNFHPDVIRCFLEQITSMTCSFAEGAGLEASGRSEDQVFMEAFHNMTEAWLNALSIDSEPWKGICKNSSMRIVTAYLRCHLAFPAGIRIDSLPDDEEYAVGDESDRVKFGDQLQNIGEFGRHCLENIIPWTANLTDERVDSLTLILNRLVENNDLNVSSQLFSLYEDLNWLMLIGGSIISYGTSEIPTEVMRYSVQYSVKTHNELTAYAFTHPTEKVESMIGPVPFPGLSVDPVVRLVIAVFRLTDLFQTFADNNLETLLSPELISTTLWFLNRFSKTYLMFNEYSHHEISIPLVFAFGRDSEGAVWALNYLLELLTEILNNSNAEPDVVEQALILLTSLVDNREKGRYALKSPSLKTLMMILPNLKFGIKRELVKNLTLAGASLPDPSSDCPYWKQLLSPVCDKLRSLMSNDEAPRDLYSEDSKKEVMDVLDCLIGIVTGSTSTTIPIIYNYLSPVMIVMPDLMHNYHNYQEVVDLILLALVKCSFHFVSYLPHMHSKNLYEASLYTIREYCNLNSNRLSLEATSEEDCFADLLLILELLSNLFTKDIFDFSRKNVVEVVKRPLVAADVCLSGLSFVMPLVRIELLKYPELSLEYFKLISYVCQFYPGKVLSLDQKMLETVLTSIEFGLKSSSEEIIPYCCDFIHFLGMHLYSTAGNGPVLPILQPFLKLLLHVTLTQTISDIHVAQTSGALYTMICCYSEAYTQLVQSVMDSQPEIAVKQLLYGAFRDLLEDIPLKIDRHSQNSFRQNFEKFILEVRGFFMG